jgi:hypothetical protein
VEGERFERGCFREQLGNGALAGGFTSCGGNDTLPESHPRGIDLAGFPGKPLADGGGALHETNEVRQLIGTKILPGLTGQIDIETNGHGLLRAQRERKIRAIMMPVLMPMM